MRAAVAHSAIHSIELELFSTMNETVNLGSDNTLQNDTVDFWGWIGVEELGLCQSEQIMFSENISTMNIKKRSMRVEIKTMRLTACFPSTAITAASPC